MITPGEKPGFKLWLKTNINQYQGDFDMKSAEGLRGTDGDAGSSFWFSSQYRRLSDENGKLLVNDIFYLEHGTEPIEKYLYKITGINAIMPHSNKNEFESYRNFFQDDELIELTMNFPPVKEDLEQLNYRF